MKALFLLERRPHPMPTPLLKEVFGRLGRRGCDVRWAIPEELLIRPDELAVEHDLYLLKSYSDLTLSVAAILHAQGARILNPYPSCIAARDKLVAVRRLREADIPIPRTWAGSEHELVARVLGTTPLVAKPSRGLHGAGVSFVPSGAGLPDRCVDGGPTIFQEHVAGSGEDLKVYVVGEEVFAVRKPFDSASFSRPGRPCPVDDGVREIALRCGAAFGLGLYGLDLVEGPDGPVVIDLNYFPGYRGVPHAAALVADYIHGFGRGQHDLWLPALTAAAH